jgi:hypothetical protein
MKKHTYKAPAEHALLVVLFVVVWVGPVLKLAGYVECSWWLAFALIWGLWVLAVLVSVIMATCRLVVKLCTPHAHRLQQVPR